MYVPISHSAVLSCRRCLSRDGRHCCGRGRPYRDSVAPRPRGELGQRYHRHARPNRRRPCIRRRPRSPDASGQLFGSSVRDSRHLRSPQ